MAGAGVALALGALARRDGAWASGWALARLRRGTLEPASPGARPPGDELGLAQALLPALEVAEVADRNFPAGLGVISDGRGHAAVAAFPGGTLPAIPAGIVAEWLADDPAGPAAAQILVEQFCVPPWDLHHRFPPTAAYRQLPHGERPVAVRSWLVVRHEPLAAPAAVARRGGGSAGARAAVAAATARLCARLAAHGAPTTPLSGAEAAELLRQLGDADGEGEARAGGWAGRAATHRVLTARVASDADWRRLLSGMAASGVERTVVAATLTLVGRTPRVRSCARLVSGLAQHAAARGDLLRSAGATGPPVADQAAGVLATLPLAHPGRPLDEAIGFVPAAPREGTAR
ncbi:hypothetical protein K4G22_03580 [Streptomyces profundus]|nr:hypothetical protein K4G22_03580 [Streptomyces sp. MA3_2.13]